MKSYLFNLLMLFSFVIYSQNDLRTIDKEEGIRDALKAKPRADISENLNSDNIDLHAYNNKVESPQYFNDKMLLGSTYNQRNVRITAAFNGWLYTAYSTYDPSTNAAGMTIQCSKNGGLFWYILDNFTQPNLQYNVFDIVIAGTDTNNLVLYLAAVGTNTFSNTNTMNFVKYDGRTGAYLGTFGNYISYGTRKVYDVAIASDYKFPSSVSAPYSIGVLYSVYGSTRDSVIFVASTNGGTSLNVRQPIFTTVAYCRDVSLDYGRSLTYSNGRYFAAWESVSSSSARNANIYTARNLSAINGVWTAPRNLDSLDSGMQGKCRRPSIAVQQNNVNNDSTNVTAVILVDRDFNGNGTDYDILGFYNRRAASNFNWKRLDIVNTSATYDMQPDIVFDSGNNNFRAVYYDSTGSKLPQKTNGMNLTNTNLWTTITSQYNDLTTNLKQAWPRIDVNPIAGKAVHVWNSEGTAGKGVALFDAEYLVSSLNEVYGPAITSDIYPNPAVSSFNLSLKVKNVQDVTMDIYDALGNVVKHEVYYGVDNTNEIKTINIADLSDGVYLLKLSSDKTVFSKKLIKASN